MDEFRKALAIRSIGRPSKIPSETIELISKLYFGEHLTARDVAVRLSLSVGTVEHYLFRKYEDMYKTNLLHRTT